MMEPLTRKESRNVTALTWLVALLILIVVIWKLI
jgi:hypothetical protein